MTCSTTDKKTHEKMKNVEKIRSTNTKIFSMKVQSRQKYQAKYLNTITSQA